LPPPESDPQLPALHGPLAGFYGDRCKTVGNYAEAMQAKGGLMPVDHLDNHDVIPDGAQGEDWPDETVAVIEAARNSARDCTETYERIMGLLGEGERLAGRAPGPRKPPKRQRRR
jgi:hypothetical protein